MRRSLLSVAVVALALYGLGCNPASSGRRMLDGGSGGDTGPGPLAGCVPSADADGDGIADGAEPAGDTDGDGLNNENDTDSDGDGISDNVEHDGGSPCSITDHDGDLNPDAYDLDSDNDGLTDTDEIARGTDPVAVDSDGDGVSDFGEVGATGGDPLDGGDHGGVAEGDFFVVLPYNGDHQFRDLDFGTNIGVADVYFLIDTTGSMGGPLANVQTSLSRISAELTTVIPDLQMGVGHHDDFPFADPDIFSFGASYGSPGDETYRNHQDITASLSAVQTALNGLTLHSGNDGPESQTEALYQTATGEGANWSFSLSGESFNLPPRSCTSVPDEIGTRRGYPCFRPGSLPIVVLVTDVTWHNGATGADPYMGISPTPHTFAQAADALNNIGARFIGACVNGGGRPDAEAMARATGSVDGSGTPLVFDASGGEVSNVIIEGIQSLVGGTPQDVSTTTEDVQPNPDATDARFFIKAITPVEGYRGTDRGPIPGVTYTSHDDMVFYGVVPGTFVTFRVDFWNDFVHPPAMAQIYRARIIVLGNGVARLDTREVFIVVPPDGDSVVVI